MDVAKASMQLSSAKVQSEASILMLAKVKENMETNGEQIVKMIESAGVNDGKSLDIRI